MLHIKEHFRYLITPGKYPGIDILRALAVSLVLLYHFDRLVVGWIGVDLFFVISGFLIGGILYDQLKSGNWSLKQFYIHRAYRILPIYYFFILLCVIVRPLVFDQDGIFGHFAPGRGIRSVLGSAVFLQLAGPYYFNLHISTQFAPGGSWSLAVEEFFYAIFPIVLYYSYAFCKKNVQRLLILFALLWASDLVLRITLAYLFPPGDAGHFLMNSFQFHSRYDEFLAGVIGAIIVREYPNISRFAREMFFTAGVFFICIFLTALYNSAYYTTPHLMLQGTLYFPTVLSLGFGLIVLGMYSTKCPFPSVIFLARISYSVYLTHIFIIEIASRYLEYNRVTHLWLLALTIVFSYLLSLLVEYPFIRRYKKPVASGSQQSVPYEGEVELAKI